MRLFIILSLAGMVIGYLLDAALGDPNVSCHPIRLIGQVISHLEHRLYIDKDCKCVEKPCFCADNYNKRQRLAGRILVILTLLTVLVVVELIRAAAYLIHPYVYMIAEALLVWLGLAQRSLETESMKVHEAFVQKDVEKARNAVAMIVGRDTDRLTPEGIMRAAVETVAENTSDGVTAPLFYCALFGSAGEYVYKAVNTMDSMIGYKNERYRDFGRCAAKVDDVFNFIPSRLSALLMLASAFIMNVCTSGNFRYDYANAAKIFRRDRLKHASPNSAQTESVCAGALDIRLAGDAVYGGVLFKKEYIGDDIRPIENDDIRRACRLMKCTGVLSLVFSVALKYVVLAVVYMSQ